VIKKPIQTLSIVAFFSLIAFSLQFFFSEPCIEYNVDYTCALRDRNSIIIMFTSLFTLLSSIFSLGIYLYQAFKIKEKDLTPTTAIRQGIELSIISLSFIILKQNNLLEIWSGILIVLIATLIELIILKFTQN